MKTISKQILLMLPVVLLSGIFQNTSAQGVKRYLLVEHFTNTASDSCFQLNPQLYSTIANYQSDIHHISYHPGVSLDDCVFYQANIPGNGARRDYYGLSSTPRVGLNGHPVTTSSALLPVPAVNYFLNLTSPLHLEVSETDGLDRTVDIKATAYGNIPISPSNVYRLFVAVVEREINLATPNGETLHHNVFRKMLPSDEGAFFLPPTIGNSVEFSFTYEVDPSWQPGQVYVVAFVQKVSSTDDVLNSGTRFDPPLVSGVFDVPNQQLLSISPNLASDLLHFDFPATEEVNVRIYNLGGEKIMELKSRPGNALDVSALQPGFYFISVNAAGKSGTGRFVKISGR